MANFWEDRYFNIKEINKTYFYKWCTGFDLNVDRESFIKEYDYRKTIVVTKNILAELDILLGEINGVIDNNSYYLLLGTHIFKIQKYFMNKRAELKMILESFKDMAKAPAPRHKKQERRILFRKYLEEAFEILTAISYSKRFFIINHDSFSDYLSFLLKHKIITKEKHKLIWDIHYKKEHFDYLDLVESNQK